jgi:methylenetetrahydrofolate reductase (NADPH)
MKIAEIIRKSRKGISFEFFPPDTPTGEDKLLERVSRLMTFSPSFVSVTRHAGPNTLERTKHIVRRIHDCPDVTVMPHITYADPDRTELAEALTYYRELGTENILILRGNPGEYGPGIFDGAIHYCHAADLVRFIAGYRDFCIGIGVYPEGHTESLNLGVDTAYVKNEMDQGAEFGISQMFFENYYYYEMLERFLQDGINIPIIAGIMPITDFQEVEHFAELGGVEIPIPLAAKLEEMESPEDVMKAGVDLATEQCLDLWENGVRHFHFYTLNNDEAVMQILNNLSTTFEINK